jgi:formate hydrogenlyase subunit 4
MYVFGIILILLTALLFPGIISWVKARLVGRKGPSLFLPYFQVLRLLKKGSVYSRTTGFLFGFAPVLNLSVMLVAILFLPLGGTKGLLSFTGDFVFVAYLFALGRFFMVLAAMDTGSGFEGMGANREALYGMLVEPAFFLIIGTLALLTGYTSFYNLFDTFHNSGFINNAIALLMAYVLIWVSMVENSRLPVDDPKTHLELTMVHEVMILDHSGFDLALFHIANALRFAFFGILITNLMIPSGSSALFFLSAYLLFQAVYASLVGGLETFRARNKIAKNPQWIITLSAIGILIFLGMLAINGKLI